MAVSRQNALVPALYRVGEVYRELPDTVTLRLVPESGRRPPCAPGQFNMLYAFGVGEIAISISGEAADEGFLHTVREVGAVSTALARLAVGASVGVRGPYGTGWPAAQGADVIFVAGGLGLAPLRPAIRRVLAEATARNADQMMVRPSATAQFNEALQRDLASMVWSAGCQSWYTQGGKVTANWPGSTTAFARATKRAPLADFVYLEH